VSALQIYAVPLKGGSRAVVMFNQHQFLDPLFNVQNLTVFWSNIGIAANTTVRPLLATTRMIKWQNLGFVWEREDLRRWILNTRSVRKDKS